jgi:pectate lyase
MRNELKIGVALLVAVSSCACGKYDYQLGEVVADGTTDGASGGAGGEDGTGTASATTGASVGWVSGADCGPKGVVGGADGPVIGVQSLDELVDAAGSDTPATIRIEGAIELSDTLVNVTSDKTLFGVDAAELLGAVRVDNARNVIIKNIRFNGASSTRDALEVTGSSCVWIDHSEFVDGGDGDLDIIRGSDFITVSWSKFWYSSEDRPERAASLVSGSSESGDTDTGKLNTTWHHNWFADWVYQRMPRALFGKGHVFNSYYSSAGNSYCIGSGSYAALLIENNYFDGVNDPHRFADDNPSHITARGNIYDNTTGVRETGLGGSGSDVTPFTDPPYPYTLDEAADVPNIVRASVGRQ